MILTEIDDCRAAIPNFSPAIPNFQPRHSRFLPRNSRFPTPSFPRRRESGWVENAIGTPAERLMSARPNVVQPKPSANRGNAIPVKMDPLTALGVWFRLTCPCETVKGEGIAVSPFWTNAGASIPQARSAARRSPPPTADPCTCYVRCPL